MDPSPEITTPRSVTAPETGSKFSSATQRPATSKSGGAGDCVPDGQKGMLGGLLAFSPAMGALAAAIVTIPGLAGPDTRLIIVAGIVTLCVLPAIIFGSPRPFPELETPVEPDVSIIDTAGKSRTVVIRMWLARLLIQISEAALFAYLFFWFRSVSCVCSVMRCFSSSLAMNSNFSASP